MYMVKYVLKRLALMFLTFFVILSACFLLIKLLPTVDPIVFGQDAKLIEMRREQMGYGKPLLIQLYLYYKSIITKWDWGIGEQLMTGQSVSAVFAKKLPATMLVNFYAILISVPLGLLLGIYAALKKNKWQDHVISTGVMIFVSVPSYVYAFLVQYFLCFRLGWFPFLMEASFDYLSLSMFISLVPAVLSLSFGTIASLTRYARAELTEILTAEFMLLARTKGLTRGQVIIRHALRNSMVPLLPMLVGEFIGILSGSLVIEAVFSIPGVGGLYVAAIQRQDYNFFMMISAFYTFIGLLTGIIVDISYGLLDPRIRMGAR